MTASLPSIEGPADPATASLEGSSVEGGAGAGSLRIAWRRLRRNRVALAFGALFLAIVALSLCAPLYARYVAKTGPDDNHVLETIVVGGHRVNVVSVRGIPIGPTWHSRFFLGADVNGRDVAVRLLYGARNSLLIAAVATLITLTFAVVFGTVAGYFRGLTDGVISRGLDIVWAYPAVLLGIALGVSLAVGGINLGVVQLHGNSLLVPAFVVGIVYVPYMAKPLRAQVLSLREREFIDAARQLGLSNRRIILREVLPNLAPTIIVFIPLLVANAILLEAGLSYLGAGVQPPNPTWGTMIADGITLVPGAIHLALIPGLMLVLTVLSINVFGDGVRDALDPFTTTRAEL